MLPVASPSASLAPSSMPSGSAVNLELKEFEMQAIPMSIEQVERWAAVYTGPREQIIFDGENLLVPDELVAAVTSVDVDAVAAAAAKKASVLREACAGAILSGYVSSALGSPHLYPSGIIDQINMMGSVTESILPGLSEGWSTPFWCRDDGGVWAFKPHTAAQIQMAGRDGKAHVVACQAMCDALTAVVLAAETLQEVEEVVWPVG